jgi:glycerophosphoryl diester phosphodiesterase
VRVVLALGGGVLIGLGIMLRVCTLGQPQVAAKLPALPFFAGLPGVLNIAHRGASSRAPEHSFEAYELALREGAQVLELDLRSTRDHVLLVAHDADLQRTLGIRATLADLTWQQVVNAAGVRAPLRLDSVFDRFPGVHFNLELKDESLEVARELARWIAARGVGPRVLVASAHYAMLDEFRRNAVSQVATSASTREALAFYACYLLGRSCPTAYAALQLPALGWLGLSSAAFIRHAHAQGLMVHYWTVDDESSMRILVRAGADGIMTNRPERLARVLGANGI